MTMTTHGRAIDPSVSPAERLEATMTAVRVSFTWLGVRKTLTPEQRQQAADQFEAQGQFLSAGKKLLDTRHPTYKAVTTVRGRILNLWKGMTLPYPEPGMRLIRQDQIELFNQQMKEFQLELEEAVQDLDAHLDELKTAAADRLGELYDEKDYPSSLQGHFAVEWDFPSIQPPDYLRRLCPQVWQQECQRVKARFDEAVQLAEQAFAEELEKLVSHLQERLSGSEDGTPRIFRDSAVTNLNTFFQRFRNLSIGSNEQLDQLVERARQAVQGVAPQALRDSESLRQRVASRLSSVSGALDQLMVERPRRRVIRNLKLEER